jgi:hypothetical protein
MKAISIVCLSLFFGLMASADVWYEDGFEDNSGDLHNRRPDFFDTDYASIAWWKNEASNLSVTNGTLLTGSSSGQQSGWIALPDDIQTGDVIRVTAVLVANGDANTDWLSLGLVGSKNHTFQKGAPYLTLTRREDAGVNTGLLKVYGGLGAGSGSLTNVNFMKEAQGFTTNLNARNTVGLEYDTGSGNLRVWMTSEGGTTVFHYDGSVNYGGVTNQPVPFDALKYAGVTFNGLNSLADADPAYVDDLTVERIPQECLFEDRFSNYEGSMHNRRPDYFDTDYASISRWKNEALNLVVTNGMIQTTTNIGQQSAWLKLPVVSSGDVIRVSAVMVANGDANADWLSIGLLPSKNHTYQKGKPYFTLTRNATGTGANMGLLKVYGGEGSGAGTLASLNYLKEAQGFTTNLNARNTAGLEYDTASGNLAVWMTSEGGTTVTQYNGSVNYNGVVGQAVPLDELTYVGLTFNGLNSVADSNPAGIDDLKVTYIPTQSTGGEPVEPAEIVGLSVSNGLLRVVINAQSATSNYYPQASAELVLNVWEHVAHSDDGLNAFAVTNLTYAGAEGTNKVIYLEMDDPVEFFRIQN